MCTGNIHRSPLAAALLQRDLDGRGVEAHVSSAGVLEDGRPAAEQIVELLKVRGLDGSAHVTRRITPDLLGTQDLILAMARDHAREIVMLHPEVMDRTFTLKELVRRGEAIGRNPAGGDLADWLQRAAAGRTTASFLGSSANDDIADPIGRRFSAFKKTAAEIEALTARLADLLTPA